MILYYTPRSHFSYKVRILLDLLKIPHEAIDIGNVTDSDPSIFHFNPIMKIPVLQDGENWLVDSDNIASYIVKKYDPKDMFHVLTNDIFDLNARAIMNEIMQEEVKIILAMRNGVPISNYTFFDKSIKAINQGLQWIEENIHKFNEQLTYREIHLFCLWWHIKHYVVVPMNYPKTESFINKLTSLDDLPGMSFLYQKDKRSI